MGLALARSPEVLISLAKDGLRFSPSLGTSDMMQGELRDQLAVERTHLANERTLLAYVRTAFASAGGGAVLLQFFPSYPALFGLAWLLVLAGGVMLAIGAYRFLKVRRELGGPSSE